MGDALFTEKGLEIEEKQESLWELWKFGPNN